MIVVSTVLYKVTIDEIAALPPLYTVIQHNKNNNTYRLLNARADHFPCMPKFEYYLFTPPPLPKTQDLTAIAEGVRV